MLSKKTQLCIDVLIAIACAPHGLAVTTQSLSERLSISPSYLESIMRVLREAGWIRAVRGPGGGYHLTQRAESIAVWDVVCSVDEPASAAPQGSARLSCSFEQDFHAAMAAHLSVCTIGQFAKADPLLLNRSAPSASGFRLGPMPAPLRPSAPNSVFQLSAFLEAATA